MEMQKIVDYVTIIALAIIAILCACNGDYLASSGFFSATIYSTMWCWAKED